MVSRSQRIRTLSKTIESSFVCLDMILMPRSNISWIKSSRRLCIAGLELKAGITMKKSSRQNDPWRSMALSSGNSSNSNSSNLSLPGNFRPGCGGGSIPLSKSMRFSENLPELYSPRRNFCNGTNSNTGFRISKEVREGVERGEAIVALESAIISHGMAYPHNIETALRLQHIIRDQGAIPATIGVIKGQLTVGLSDEEIEELGRPISENGRSGVPVIKVSRRDLPFALSQKLDGGTTVSGTIVGAVKAGIPIFATGGIGGVHRGGETSFDISADLRELGRNPITVISAGVKSILDIGKTLEYLETEGVCVAVLKRSNQAYEDETETRVGYQNQDSRRKSDPTLEKKDETGKSVQIGRVKFPSFFTAESRFTAPYSLTDELQAAHLVNSSINFGLRSGILIAVPIPKEHEAGGQEIEKAVGKALEKAAEMGVEGKDMTPFLLGEISRLTSGDSLLANKYLIENNVRVATQIAILLAKLRRTGRKEAEGLPHYSSSPSKGGRISDVRDDKQNTWDGRSFGNSNVKDGVSHGNHFSKDHERFIDSSQRPGPEFHIPNSPINEGSISRLKGTNVQSSQAQNRRPVVIGGSSLDLILSVQEEKIVSDGRTHKAKIRTSAGGVGRNVAEALYKLGHNPLLISAIGKDLFGRELMRHFQETEMETSKIFLGIDSPTAIYSALLNHHGECEFGLGDMTIHSEITPSVITQNCSEVIRSASIVVLDGNLSVDTMTAVMRICMGADVPVWFEPTEVRKAKKILQVPREYWAVLRYISPNLQELTSITGIDLKDDLSKETDSSGTNNTCTFDLPQLRSLFSQCFQMFPFLHVILFTLGKDGILVISREDDDDRTLTTLSHSAPDMKGEEIKSVSGAGDCLNAGFISGILENMSLEKCAQRGTFCAKKSLQSMNNVPDNFTRN